MNLLWKRSKQQTAIDTIWTEFWVSIFGSHSKKVQNRASFFLFGKFLSQSDFYVLTPWLKVILTQSSQQTVIYFSEVFFGGANIFFTVSQGFVENWDIFALLSIFHQFRTSSSNQQFLQEAQNLHHSNNQTHVQAVQSFECSVNFCRCLFCKKAWEPRCFWLLLILYQIRSALFRQIKMNFTQALWLCSKQNIMKVLVKIGLEGVIVICRFAKETKMGLILTGFPHTSSICICFIPTAWYPNHPIIACEFLPKSQETSVVVDIFCEKDVETEPEAFIGRPNEMFFG